MLDSTDITKIQFNATTPLFGYSRGTLAFEWAGELLSTYVPDVKIAGAIGGLPINITQTFSLLDGASNSGLIVGILNRIGNAFPPIAEYIEVHLNPEFKPEYDLAMTTCAANVYNSCDGYVSQLPDQGISAFFGNGFSVVLEFAELLDTVCYGPRRGPRVPDVCVPRNKIYHSW